MTMNKIKVKLADGVDVHSIPAMRTDVGPVVAVKEGVAYVFALLLTNDASRADQLYKMMRATSMTG